MILTRQHFQLIADVVKNIDDSDTRRAVALDFLHNLQKTNPNFKPGMFLVACGTTAEKSS